MYRTHPQPRDSVASDRIGASVRLRPHPPRPGSRQPQPPRSTANTISPRKSRTTRQCVTAPEPVDAISPITGFPSTYEQSTCLTKCLLPEDRDAQKRVTSAKALAALGPLPDISYPAYAFALACDELFAHPHGARHGLGLAAVLLVLDQLS